VASASGGIIAANSQTVFFAETGYLSGLNGTYFDQMNLTGNTAVRVDGPIDFNWAAGAPGVGGIGVNNFSVRWQGFVTAPVTGSYTFRTRSDDGVRLYVNGNLVINNWGDHSAIDNDSAAIALTAGQRYPLTMEFYENGGDAVAQLSWSGPSTGGFQFIPLSALSRCGGALPTPRAYYKLDEAAWNAAGDVADSSGNGLNGTAVGGATPVPAKVCNGAQLNGANRYIQVADNNLLRLTGNFTVMAWINANALGTELKTIVSKDENYEFHLTDTGQINWWWQNSGGTAQTFTTTGAAIVPGNWYHIAIVYASGNQTIYINGASRGTAAFTGGLLTNGDPLQIGSDQGSAGRFFDGLIDEVRIYGSALSNDEVIAIRDITRPCAIAFSHIRIEHTGQGLTCEPATVTVKACADATCSTLYPGPVTTTLSPTGWVTSDTINFTGQTTAQLRKTTPGAITLGAGSTAPAPASGTLCFNGLAQTCNLDFQDSGFIFSTIPTQIAGTPSATQTLRAVRKSDSGNACVGVFNGNVNIELASQCVNPATCQAGQQATITNNGATAIAANPGSGVSAWTTKSMTFGANSTANFTLNYPDVGAIRLHARHNIAGSGNYMTGVSNDFVVRPAGFVVNNIRRTADSVANPGAANAAGAVFIKAGESITLTATAVNAQGNATPNYGRETTAEGVRLTTALVPGLGLSNNPALGNGTIAGGLFSAGSATVTNVTWDEVGIITITPGVGDSNYLGTGDVTGTATGNIGRFTPHHFDVSANAPVFATACTAGAFTYIGQPFDYAEGMEPVLTVTARNLAGGTTANYKGTAPAGQAFFKITAGSLTGKVYTAASGALDVSTVTTPDPAILAAGNGTGTLTFNSGDGLKFIRSAPQLPFNAEISLAINVIDTDGVAYSTNPARFGQASAGNGIAFSTGKTLRFGRLRLSGASGSQLLPLDVPFEVQYWTGTFFATNTADTCTTVTGDNVALGNSMGNLGVNETTVTVGALAAGRGAIRLSAPGAGNNGSLDVALNLGTGTSVVVCPAFTPAAAEPGALTHLRGQWCGAAYDRDPTARVRFGISSGSDERIYMREDYFN
jgi:MSHA biogenesis protein MshQ